MSGFAGASPAPLLTAECSRVLGARPYEDKRLIRVRRGVYTPSAAWAQLKPWERYLCRVHAAALAFTDAALCLESAGVLLGLPLFGEPRDIHLLVIGGKSRRYGDVVIHSTLDEREFVAVGGVRATTVVDTVADLSRTLPPAFALAVADAGLRRLSARGNVDLREVASGHGARRGLAQLGWVADRATPVAESPGESVSRAVIEWLGYEPPDLQVVFHYEGTEDRADFYWRRLRVVGESDGYGKYDAGDVHKAKAHFIDEKKREDRLRRHEDGFARWDWSDTMRAEPLDAKLRSAGLNPIHPRQATMLATLRRPSR